MVRNDDHGDMMSADAIHKDLGIGNGRKPHYVALRVVKDKIWFARHDHTIPRLVGLYPGRGFHFRVHRLPDYFGLQVVATADHDLSGTLFDEESDCQYRDELHGK